MAEVIQNLPNVPYKSAISDNNGLLTPIWAQFFRQLFVRNGGSIAPSNAQLGANTGAIGPLQTQVASLQTTVNTLQSNINDILQGPTP